MSTVPTGWFTLRFSFFSDDILFHTVIFFCLNKFILNMYVKKHCNAITCVLLYLNTSKSLFFMMPGKHFLHSA